MMNALRKSFTVIAATALLASTSGMGVAQSQSAAPTGTAQTNGYETAIASSVRVLAVQGDGSVIYGTGWVIRAADDQNSAGASVVITARHVVAGAARVRIIASGAAVTDQKPATVIGGSVDQDVAFLEVKDLDKPALRITRARPGIGANVAAAGYTHASDRSEAERAAKSASLKRGGLSKYFRGERAGGQAPVDLIEFDAPILAGFSGGPLLNECGSVVGMTLSDGGHIEVGQGGSIALAQGVGVAVAANEIIRAARAQSVEVTAIDSACGASDAASPAPPPPPAPCPKPYMSVDGGKPCTPINPTSGQAFLHSLKGPIGLLVIIAGLGLLLVLGTIIWMLNRRRRPQSSHIGSESYAPGIGGSDLLDKGSSKVRGGAAALRLTGRGPSGEAIDLRFTPDELASAPVMLGVEGASNGRIPDGRAKTLVSRKHAQLAFDGQNFTIEDNKSMNGTKVDGVRLEPFVKRVIVSGDSIMLADVALHVTVE